MIKGTVPSKENSVEDWLKSLSMDNMNLKEGLTKDVPMTNVLPPPCQVLNQSAEYQVIEKAAQLLKKVEQHWKKSLFQNRLQFSPVSDSLNSSESEQYIEKLAAIKFKDASFRNKPIFPHVDGQQHNINHAFRREASLEQNLLMSYDVVSNYFDLVGSKDTHMNSSPGSARARGDEHFPTKCQRCLEKDRAHGEMQKKSLSTLPRQQYVFKQNNYGRRGGFSKSGRDGLSVQVSPRSHDSLPTSRTYASASPLPRSKTNFSYRRTTMSSSNPDLRNINVRECTRHRQQTSARCYQNYCGTDRLNSSYRDSVSKTKAHMGDGYHDLVKNNNVSIVNVTSNSQEISAIPEVNPRKITSAPDKLIIIQHLPQVDIRPELSKQSGPIINIEADANAEEEKDMKNNNIGVFNYIHKNAIKQAQVKEHLPFSSYHKLSGNNTCSEEESFAAQLELRSVAENFVYRLKKNDNASGLVLMSTLLRLIDEVNELIDLHLSDSSGTQPDPNLPPRMEMVSDLLSDELKTWGAQHPAHYQRLNNIIQHLILDIHFVKNGNFDIKEFGNAVTLGHDVNPSSSKKASILKKSKNLSHFDHYNHHRHISLNGESNYEKERSDAYTHRSNHSEELSLSDKLLQENALKVQRLEKAYKINHRVRIIQRKEEAKKIIETEVKNDLSRNSSISDALQIEDKTENSPDSNRQQSLNGMSSNDSHPVVAIISPSQIESRDEEDKTISERASVAEDDDKSVAEEIQEDGDLESISEDPQDSPSKPSGERTKSPGNLSDKPVSDIEDEVEEVLSESSHPPGDKQAAASDYDEDFEPDVTENPSQSATASSLNEKESSQ